MFEEVYIYKCTVGAGWFVKKDLNEMGYNIMECGPRWMCACLGRGVSSRGVFEAVCAWPGPERSEVQRNDLDRTGSDCGCTVEGYYAGAWYAGWRSNRDRGEGREKAEREGRGSKYSI